MFKPCTLSVFSRVLRQCAIGFMVSSLLANAASAAVDSSRSLLVTDKAILDEFPLSDVFGALLTSAGDTSQSPQDVLDNWPVRTETCTSTEFNGFPTVCPSVSLGNVEDYQPIALINRFDLADENGTTCGEHRIAYVMTLGFGIQANFAIFEASLPNPTPALGKEGCRPVAEFWASLSDIDDEAERTALLRDFYFNGLTGFSPVFHTQNFAGGDLGSGQIRFNQRISRLTTWGFFEFATVVGANGLVIEQRTVKENAFEELSSPTTEFSVEAQLFEDAVIAGLAEDGEGLLAKSFTDITFDLPEEVESGNRGEDVFGDELLGGVLEFFDAESPLAAAIQTQLDVVGSALTPAQVMARVNSQSCGGCHNNAADLGEFTYDASDIFVEMLSFEGESTSTPVRIQAEDFSQANGVQTEATSDEGAGLNVGWIDDGDSLSYSVTVPRSADGTYTFNYRLAANGVAFPAGEFQLVNADTGEIYDTRILSATGGWQNWETLQSAPAVSLPEGPLNLEIVVLQGGWNINWFEIVPAGIDRFLVKAPLRDVFIPARLENLEAFLGECTDCVESTRIEAEDFNSMSGVQTEATTDVGGGLNVGWLDAGDWMAYDVDLPISESGFYEVTYRVASNDADGGSLQLEQSVGGQVLANTNVPNTGGWQSWISVTQQVQISEGSDSLTLVVLNGGFNVNWLEITPIDACTDCNQNLLTNGDFSDAGFAWSTYVNNASDAEFTLGGQFDDARVSMHNGGTEVWHAQLYQAGVSLVQGKTYRLSFDHTTASRSVPSDFQVVVEQNGGSYTSYMSAQTILPNPGNQTFEIEFTMQAASDSAARVTFNFGGSVEDPASPGRAIFVDNVSLIEL